MAASAALPAGDNNPTSVTADSQDSPQQDRDAVLEQDRAISQLRYDRMIECLSSDYQQDKDAVPLRVSGTLEWFLQRPDFTQWIDSTTSSMLHVHAGPGCGKSVLSRFLIDERKVARSADTPVLYFFFKEGEKGRVTSDDAIAAILHQLYTTGTHEVTTDHAVSAYGEHWNRLRGMFGELWRILEMTIDNHPAGEIVIVIDALGECEHTHREQLLGKFAEYFHRPAGGQPAGGGVLKVILTSRSDAGVDNSQMPPIANGTLIRFDGSEHSNDIRADMKLVIEERATMMPNLEPQLHKTMVEKLLAVDEKTHLWLHLVLEYLSKDMRLSQTMENLESLLDHLPVGVYATYEKLLRKTTDYRKASYMTAIVGAAKRAPTVAELSIALEVSINDHGTYGDFIQEIERHQDTQNMLQVLCGSLLDVRDGKVYLRHQTVRQFLKGTTFTFGSHSESPRGPLDFVQANILLARTCIQFLGLIDDGTWSDTLQTLKESNALAGENLPGGSTQAGEIPGNDSDSSDTAPRKRRNFREENYQFYFGKTNRKEEEQCIERLGFMHYASHLWLEHFRSVQHQVPPSLVEKAKSLCDPATAQCQHWLREYARAGRYELARLKDPLEVAAFVGLDAVVALLIANGADTSSPNHWNAVRLATIQAHPAVMKVLLGAGADGDIALRSASYDGQTALVKILLDLGADVNSGGTSHSQPLELAAGQGHGEIVRLLLDRGADVNAQHGAAVKAAIKGRHLDLVKALIDNGADLNLQHPDHDGPLQVAASQDDKNAVKLLLDAGADINAQGGNWLGSALQAAASSDGHDAVEMLLGAGADANVQGGRFWSALQAAAAHGTETSVKLLLSARADVNALGGHFGSPLQASAALGSIEKLEMLLAAGADVKSQGGLCGSPLGAAAHWGRSDVVERLLTAGAKVNIWGGNYDSPLQAAAIQLHEEVVGLLLASGADITRLGTEEGSEWMDKEWSSYGRVLWRAAERGLPNVARCCFAANIDVNDTDSRFQKTPLHYAAREGHFELVRMLVEQGARVDIVDKNGRTPIDSARRALRPNRGFRDEETVEKIIDYLSKVQRTPS